MYNNPYINELTDERLELISQETIDNTVYLNFTLHPKDVNECPNCHKNDIIKYGSNSRKLNVKILSHCKTSVTVKCTKFKCKFCNTYFMDEFKDVSKNTTIAKSTIINVLIQLKQNLSFKDIASLNGIDSKTVINIMEQNVKADRKPFKDVLCFDEFKNLKSTIGKYAFFIYDPTSELCIDVLRDRRLDHLEDYFLHIDYAERKKVKYIITDMNEAYRTVKNKMFPDSTHVIDSFHYIRYITNAMMNLRLRIQKMFAKTSPEYTLLMRQWRLLQTDIKQIEEGEIYNNIRRKKTSKCDAINDMLALSDELTGGYDLLQEFYRAWDNTKYENVDEFMDTWIKSLNETIIPEFQNLASTFTNWRKEISNSFIRFGEKRLSNGPIEGMNNRIKSLKRAAFGFSNFEHFRLRIFMIINKEINFRNPKEPLLITRKKRNIKK